MVETETTVMGSEDGAQATRQGPRLATGCYKRQGKETPQLRASRRNQPRGCLDISPSETNYKFLAPRAVGE